MRGQHHSLLHDCAAIVVLHVIDGNGSVGIDDVNAVINFMLS